MKLLILLILLVPQFAFADIVLKRPYGAAATITFALWEPDATDQIDSAACATGDIKLSKDEGAEANTTNCFADEGRSYSLALTATEMECARCMVTIVDQSTKAYLDRTIIIETYGTVAGAQHDTGADVEKWAGTAVGTPATNGYPVVTIKDGTGSGEVDTNGGAVVAVTTTGTVTTVSDKTGYRLSATGIDDVWDELQSGHTTPGTFGKYLDDEITDVSGGGGGSCGPYLE